jgi:hypothetical protein
LNIFNGRRREELEERDGPTRVSTEKSLHGSRVSWIFGSRKLKDNLDNWLAALKRKVEAGKWAPDRPHPMDDSPNLGISS